MNGGCAPEGRLFPLTHWSLVARAADETQSGQRQALGQLLAAYLPALRVYLLHRRGIDRHQAEDLLQGFVADRVLEHNLVARANRSRGRFRNLLLSSLDNYVANTLRHQHAAVRNPGPMGRLDAEPADDAGHADGFETAWARQIIAQALQRMREQCLAAGREDIWGIFDCRVRAPLMEGAPAPSYPRLVRLLGFRSPMQAANALITAKRMFQRILREVVGQYVCQEDIDAEIDDLIAILSRARRIDAAGG